MKRIYDEVIAAHFAAYRQMLFFTGPRQVGKTTSCTHFSHPDSRLVYFNWDNVEHRAQILAGPQEIATAAELDKLVSHPPFVVFDEIHKFKKWKDFLKGFFDTYGNVHTIVTGSARLNLRKRAGDSLMGRYFPYRVHPLSVAELNSTTLRESEIDFHPQKISDDMFNALLQFGGFPEPFLKQSARFSTRWRNLRFEQLFREDMLELTRIQEVNQMEILAELLTHQIAGLSSHSSLATKVRVSAETVKRWLELLRAFYYCFSLKPYSKNVARSLIKEPKYFLWDWASVDDEGARNENFIASHLLKAVHFWTDQGLGVFELNFLRDKDKREVDFLVTKDSKPWFLVEVKSSQSVPLSPQLAYYQGQTGAKHAFQVAIDMPFIEADCFAQTKPIIVPAKTFLAQLV